MHWNVFYGCISRKCKNKTQKFWMLKKLSLVILIKKFIFKADNIKSGCISFLPAKFRRLWCRLFLDFGCKKWTFWLIWRQIGPEMARFTTCWTQPNMCFLLSMRVLDLIFCMIWTNMGHIIYKKAFLVLGIFKALLEKYRVDLVCDGIDQNVDEKPLPEFD